MKQILKGMAEAAKRTAKASVNSASFFAAYQPKEPDVLKKRSNRVGDYTGVTKSC